MAILEDIVIPLHQEIIARVSEASPNIVQAIILFKVPLYFRFHYYLYRFHRFGRLNEIFGLLVMDLTDITLRSC
jgi:hypothetical protein